MNSGRKYSSVSSRQILVSGLLLSLLAIVQGVHHEQVDTHHLAIKDVQQKNKENLKKLLGDENF